MEQSVQHLRDNGELTGTPKDIGRLIKEVREDIVAEEKENIKDQLWEIYKNDFLGVATNGLPQYYKDKLVLGEVNETIENTENDRQSEDIQEVKEG